MHPLSRALEKCSVVEEASASCSCKFFSQGNQTLLDTFFDVPQEDACDYSDDAVRVKAPASVIDEYTRLQIQLICRVGLPLATLKSCHWKDLLSFLGSDVKVTPSRLRASLLLYSDEIKARNYAQLKGQLVSIITDGGTITDKEFYIVILYCNGKFYFAGALHLPHTDHDAIAEALAPVIDAILNHQGKPIAIVTDNARNLKLATTDTNQPGRTIDTSAQISSIQSRTGQPILHISCTIHSAHLLLLLLLCSAALRAAHCMHAFASRSHCLARVRLTFGLRPWLAFPHSAP